MYDIDLLLYKILDYKLSIKRLMIIPENLKKSVINKQMYFYQHFKNQYFSKNLVHKWILDFFF